MEISYSVLQECRLRKSKMKIVEIAGDNKGFKNGEETLNFCKNTKNLSENLWASFLTEFFSSVF